MHCVGRKQNCWKLNWRYIQYPPSILGLKFHSCWRPTQQLLLFCCLTLTQMGLSNQQDAVCLSVCLYCHVCLLSRLNPLSMLPTKQRQQPVSPSSLSHIICPLHVTTTATCLQRSSGLSSATMFEPTSCNLLPCRTYQRKINPSKGSFILSPPKYLHQLRSNYVQPGVKFFNLYAPCVLYIRTGVSLLSRERFLYI